MCFHLQAESLRCPLGIEWLKPTSVDVSSTFYLRTETGQVSETSLEYRMMDEVRESNNSECNIISSGTFRIKIR
jgi:hypothetical protein